MTARPPYQIKVDEQELIVRVDRDVVDLARVSTFLHHLELESARHRSALPVADAHAQEIDGTVCNRGE